MKKSERIEKEGDMSGEMKYMRSMRRVKLGKDIVDGMNCIIRDNEMD